MSTQTTPTRGLSTAEIEEIRSTLAAGRKPKVMFTTSAGQIAGQIGQVVSLGDPADSDEWLMVRFGKDELPFSPQDLTIPPKGRSRAASSSNSTSSATSNAAAATSTAAASQAPAAVPAPRETSASTKTSTAAAAGGGSDANRNTRRGRSSKGGRPKPPPAMTVTLAYEAGEWTVAASQGNRVLAKPYVIRPSEALQMVALLDVPGVQEAVEQIVAAEVAEAQQRAETLRNELAEVEARLEELTGATQEVAQQS